MNISKTWAEAQDYCRAYFTDLATVDNKDEMDNLTSSVTDTYNGSAWIGLYDNLTSWKWSLEDSEFYGDGDREYRNWDNFTTFNFLQPNNDGGQQLCVEMLNNSFWNDRTCDSYKIQFICYDGK